LHWNHEWLELCLLKFVTAKALGLCETNESSIIQP
jgi:hypothetical protein